MNANLPVSEESPKVFLIKEIIKILNQSLEKVDENDFFSASIHVGIAIHNLENLQQDLSCQLLVEKKLRKILDL